MCPQPPYALPYAHPLHPTKQVKYNQKRVDNFARLRYQKAVFIAWKAYYGKQAIVKRKYQHKLAMFVKR